MKVINKKSFIDYFMLFLLILFIVLFLFSVVKIILWIKDNKSTKDILNNINKTVIVKDIKDNNDSEIINQKKEIKKEDPYWDFIKYDLIDVDLNKLKQKNSDTIGWIKVEGTNINYPFVQTTDNDYYLDHSYNKSNNSAGWIFMDYRNNNFDNKNIIIYAHGRYDNTMFGSLKKALKKDWLNNNTNHIVKISTEKYNLLYQVFSIYSIPATTDYLTINFSSNESFNLFANNLIKRSIHNFNTSIDENDFIVTLSTCLNQKERLVLHAKLIKRQSK